MRRSAGRDRRRSRPARVPRYIAQELPVEVRRVGDPAVGIARDGSGDGQVGPAVGGRQGRAQDGGQEAAGGVVGRPGLGQRGADVLAGDAEASARGDEGRQGGLGGRVQQRARPGQHIAGERRQPEDAPVGGRHLAGGDAGQALRRSRIRDGRLGDDGRLIGFVDRGRDRAAGQDAPDAVLLRVDGRDAVHHAAVVRRTGRCRSRRPGRSGPGS